MKTLPLLAWRRFMRRPWQAILGIVSIALGVSVVLAIDLTNASARLAFERAGRDISGGVTHSLTGGPGGIDENLYVNLRKRHGLHEMMPVVEGSVTTLEGVSLRMTGIDPALMAGETGQDTAVAFSTSPLSLMTQPGAVAAGGGIRDRLGLDIGGKIIIRGSGGTQDLMITGFIRADDTLHNQALQNTLIADIATAQEILGMSGKLSRVDLVLNETQAERLRTLIQPPLQLVSSAGRTGAMEQMTRAFRTNLTALSLLALMIGAFLIYNTMTVSVLQRRDLIATLRTMGVSRRELLGLFMGEALLLALAGVLAGWALGMGLSHYLLSLTSRTLEDLYAINEVRAIHFSGFSFIKSAALGITAALLAVFLPVRDALRIAPELARSRSRLERRVRGNLPRQLAGAALLACAGMAVLLLSGRGIAAGFLALFLIIMAYALLSPVLMVYLVRLLGPVMSAAMGLMGSIASRGLLASLSRTRVAVTALAIAISATIGVSIMIGSFRLSVEAWLDDFLKADIFISPANEDGATAIPPGLVSRLERLPGVAGFTTGSWRELWRDEQLTRLYVSGIDETTFNNYRFMRGPEPDRWRDFRTGDSVIISEPYAWHNRLQTGDILHLPTPAGLHPFRVAGVFQHYGSDQGIVTMHRDVYRRHWRDDTVQSLHLYLDEAVDAGSLADRLNAGILQAANLRAMDNRRLRELSLKVFDRTFAVTEVLRLITIVVAVIGILGALMAIQLERGREFAVLRATGVTPGELKRLILAESGLMGGIAGLIAIPLGLALALILIHVINRRSFGWSMEFVADPAYLANALLLGLAAGILAGVYPAWRAAAPPVSALN